MSVPCRLTSTTRLLLIAGAGVATIAVAAPGLMVSAAAASSCGRAGLRAPAGLPAPVVATTGCGRFLVEPSGRVRLLGPPRLPVPAGVDWYSDLSWYRLEQGHVVIGQGKTTLWRSDARYGSRYGVGAVSARRIAFSYAAPPEGWKRPTLYLAALGGAEAVVARGETPLGWTAGGRLVTWGSKGVLRVRASDGALVRTLARSVYTFVFDRGSRSFFFLAHGRLLRFDGQRLRTLARLASLSLAAPLTLEPVGRLIALRGQRRLVVLDRRGVLVSSTRLPHGRLRTDRVSSSTTADGSGDVAFTAMRGNTANGSAGVETVYLLARGARSTRPLFRERVAFAVCERQATLAWRGRWLLYATSEGYAAAINTSSREAIDLSQLTLLLLGLFGEGFQAGWA